MEGSSVYYMEICVTNTHYKPITFLQDYLPWKSPAGFVLLAVKADAFSTLLQNAPQPIDDPRVEKIMLRPGEKLCGKISLNKRFGELNDVLKEKDVIIFWNWKWVLDGGPAPRRYGGWL